MRIIKYLRRCSFFHYDTFVHEEDPVPYFTGKAHFMGDHHHGHALPGLITSLTIIMAAIGLFFISVPPDSFTLSYGDLLVLVGAFGFAMHIITVDLYSHKHNAVAITAVQIFFVGLVCSIVGLIVEPVPPYLSYNTLFAIIITAVFATALAFLLQNYMQKFSTPTRFAVVLTTEPVFAGLAGYWWAGEHLGRLGLIGAGMILVAMLLAIRGRA